MYKRRKDLRLSHTPSRCSSRCCWNRYHRRNWCNCKMEENASAERRGTDADGFQIGLIQERREESRIRTSQYQIGGQADRRLSLREGSREGPRRGDERWTYKARMERAQPRVSGRVWRTQPCCCRRAPPLRRRWRGRGRERGRECERHAWWSAGEREAANDGEKGPKRRGLSCTQWSLL